MFSYQYFNKRGSTLSVACVDIKKAFDKANIWGILRLLQQNHIAPNIIEVLKQWFLMSSARVKWNGILSEPVFLSSGVRQGGVLSPLLFSAYVDVVLSELGKSSLGCFINKRCFNSFMYADDLILLSISVADLQSLLSLSVEIFGTLDLQINAKTTVCLRIGKRWRAPCHPMSVVGLNLDWVDETKYLGIVIKGGKNLSCNWQSARSS